MPTVQSTYDDNIRAAVAGMRANEEPCTLISRNVETEAGIGFGVGIMQGTEDKQCLISDGSTLLGITVRERSVDPATPNLFAENESARIMTSGVIWVLNTGGVAAGDPVHVLAAGAFSNTGGTLIENARWDTTAATATLAQLRLGSPVVGSAS
jgi:hypothetical protein